MKGNMKKIIFASILLFSSNAYAGISVCFDSEGAVTQMSISSPPQDGCDYYDVGNGINQAQDNVIREIIKTVPQRYIKKVNGFPAEMSTQEKVAVDDALTNSIKNQQITRIDSGEVSSSELLKAVASVISESASYKEITEEVIKEKIKEQAGLK